MWLPRHFKLASRASIWTPPLEMKAALGGYGERMSRPATGVHDRVWAKALVFRDGEKRRALVTADVLAFPPGFRETVALALGAEGWQADDLLLLPSHTHTSFDMTALNPKNTLQIPQLGLFHKELHAWTVAKLAEVIQNAARNPVPIAAGSSTHVLMDWNRNRRGNGAVDRDLTLARIDTTDGQPWCGRWRRPLDRPNDYPQHPAFSTRQNSALVKGLSEIIETAARLCKGVHSLMIHGPMTSSNLTSKPHRSQCSQQGCSNN
ncbi:MAG TPA: neutral/alkaline non-lysosomal ceramidase N-terminal domain-containing protein [Candidatus Paceibacterota bacterium]|nr:neutral/alkaline non-lysosomal ceramidase N-terminal domain-containing protein [Candidatus Paceibacterota bacterium]